MGGVRRDALTAVRVPRRPAAQPPRAASTRELRDAAGGAPRVARAARRGRRLRAPPTRARPARRRAVASRGAGHAAARRAGRGDGELAAMLDHAQEELQTSLGRAARAGARHPPGGAERARPVPALEALGLARAGARDVEADARERLPEPVETAAYFVVSEALANVAKYAQATHASVVVRRSNGRVTVDVPTTASAAPSRRAARGCAGSPTASPRSRARCRWRARRATGRAFTPRSRSDEQLHVAPLELRLDPRHVAELGRAHRREVLRVREQHPPRVAEPLVEADSALRALGLEVRGRIADAQGGQLLCWCVHAATLRERPWRNPAGTLRPGLQAQTFQSGVVARR